MAESTNKVAFLKEHLQKTPMKQIFENCKEKNNLTALQFMCIVDFHTNDKKLYARINETGQPKLLGQLLQFKKFETFRYYNYEVKRQYGNYNLQCQYCTLVGPAICILNHLTINHNVHTGLKSCIFCNVEELETHNKNNDLGQCYINYIQRNNIEIDENVCKIVANFYEMMTILCKRLNICSTRKKGYNGKGYKYREFLDHNYGDDISRECEVRYMIPKNQQNRAIESETLTREVERIMNILYGGYANRSRNDRTPAENQVFVVDDSDNSGDDNEVNHITQNRASGSSQHCDTGNGRQYENSLTYEEPFLAEVSIGAMTTENLIKHELISRYSATPSVSSYEMDTTSILNGRRSNRLLTPMSNYSGSFNNWDPGNDITVFAMNMARNLEKLPSGNVRFKLQNNIEKLVIDAVDKAIDEGMIQ